MSTIPKTEQRTNLPSQLLHDLRNPLNQIIGYSEMLAEETTVQPREVVVADLGKITAAGHRMLALIDDNFAAGNRVVTGGRGADRRQPAPERSQSFATLSAPGLLLVVDDDAANRDVLSRRLRRQGHVVRTANNGRDALDLVREDSFDLVLLDIMMPEMDGYEVLSGMKADPQLTHVPVIMISAVSEMQSVVRCIEAGAEDYLTKPFDPILLRARIGACLEKKRGRDRETALYEQVQENYRRLQEVEKLRDDMRNMIVHDLRTPLSALIMGIRLLGKEGVLNDSQSELLRIATTGGNTLLGMINDLLDIEKMEAGSTQLVYEEMDVASFIAAALEQVAALAADGETTIETDIDSDLPRFKADAGKLTRTLVNLIANAIRFAGPGIVSICASRDDSSIRFAVRDRGKGIPEEAFGRIFDKFAQLDAESRRGTGLGLAFCKLAVEAHGGTIGVDSTVGVGSTFSFTIPIGAREVPSSEF